MASSHTPTTHVAGNSISRIVPFPSTNVSQPWNKFASDLGLSSAEHSSQPEGRRDNISFIGRQTPLSNSRWMMNDGEWKIRMDKRDNSQTFFDVFSRLNNSKQRNHKLETENQPTMSETCPTFKESYEKNPPATVTTNAKIVFKLSS